MKKKKSKADLHTHTNYTDGFSSPKKMVDKAIKVGLDLIAITDHNIIKGALAAKDYVKQNDLPIKVVVGEEISTTEGEIVGLDLKRAIPPFLTPKQTAKEIKRQGGVVFAPHPHRVIIGYSLSFTDIDKLAQENLIDGLEVYNFWDYSKKLIKKRQAKNKKWKLSVLANTDSHHFSTLGHCYTEFPGETINDLKQAVKHGRTKPHFNRKYHYYLNRQFHHGVVHLFHRKPDYPGSTPLTKKILHLVKLLRK